MARMLWFAVAVTAGCRGRAEPPAEAIAPPSAPVARPIAAPPDAAAPIGSAVATVTAEPAALAVSGDTVIWIDASEHRMMALDGGATTPRVLASDCMDSGGLLAPLSISGTRVYYLKAGAGRARVARVELAATAKPSELDVTPDLDRLIGVHAIGETVIVLQNTLLRTQPVGWDPGGVKLARPGRPLVTLGEVYTPPVAMVGDSMGVVVIETIGVERFADKLGSRVASADNQSFVVATPTALFQSPVMHEGQIVETVDGRPEILGTVPGLAVAGALRGDDLFIGVVGGRPAPTTDLGELIERSSADLARPPTMTQIVRLDIKTHRVAPVVDLGSTGVSRHFAVAGGWLYFVPLHPVGIRRIAAP